MRTIGLTIAAAVAGWISLAAGSPKEAPKWTQAKPAGEAVDCLPLRQIRRSEVRDERTIDFFTGGRRTYRNTLPNSCPGLNLERAFSYRTSLTQLCSVDIITVVSRTPGGPGASCGLGKFQPVELPR